MRLDLISIALITTTGLMIVLMHGKIPPAYAGLAISYAVQVSLWDEGIVFLIRWKVMTNLDSILKRRDITLLSKIHLVKAIVFPVVMYGCESWTIKKAEH